MSARKNASLLVVLALAACATTASRPEPVQPAPPPVAPPAAAAEKVPVPPLGDPADLRLPATQRFTLSNGLPVRLVEYHRLPIVAVQLVLLEAGAARDPASLPGVASFTASMVTEGTTSRSAIQLSEELGFLGASLGAGAGMDSAQVSGYALSRHLPRLLDLLGDVVANPAFPASDFARVQDQRKVSLLQQRDQPGAIATKTFGKLFWGDHPYGHWAGGTEASVAKTTRQDLVRFHADHWRPGAAELVVVGDVDAVTLRAELERALSGWKGAAPARLLALQDPVPRRRAVLVEKRGAPQTFLVLGMPGIARSDPDFVTAQVLFQVLGGGSSSRLFRDLREDKGYTYGLSARESASRLGGLSYMGGSVRADATGQAIGDLLAQARALRDVPVPAAELDDAKDGIVRSLPGDFATASGIAGRLAEQVVYGLPENWWATYPARVRAVTAADVQRVARRVLDVGALVTVMVGDPEVVRPQLSGLPLGDVQERKP
ncbi:MAG: pitrilysin family protein [Deltaproteobacteria bacterium]